VLTYKCVSAGISENIETVPFAHFQN